MVKYSLIFIFALLLVIPISAQSDEDDEIVYTEDVKGGLWFTVPTTEYRFNIGDIEGSFKRDPVIASIVLLVTIILISGIIYLYYKTVFQSRKRSKFDAWFGNHLIAGFSILLVIYWILMITIGNHALPSS